jgi:hypothetical protein
MSPRLSAFYFQRIRFPGIYKTSRNLISFKLISQCSQLFEDLDNGCEYTGRLWFVHALPCRSSLTVKNVVIDAVNIKGPGIVVPSFSLARATSLATRCRWLSSRMLSSRAPSIQHKATFISSINNTIGIQNLVWHESKSTQKYTLINNHMKDFIP